MDFAKAQLEKYGWREGKGLGKEENGISVALKPQLKFDKFGIGHDMAQEFTNNWWEHLYDTACNNINVKQHQDNVQLEVDDVDKVEISTKNYSVKNSKSVKNKLLEYGSFLKTSKLTPSGVVDLGNNNQGSIVQYHTHHSLTDEDIFAACGRRTGHKGARHGIKQNGKLSRIEKQEKLLLKQLKRVSLSDDTNMKLEKKLKKIADHKNRNIVDVVEVETFVVDLPSGNQCVVGSPSSTKSKKRKKDRRRVSFNETVTEYSQTTDEETNPNCSTENVKACSPSPSTPVTKVRLLKIKEKEVDNNGNVSSQEQDEGIDCTNYDEAKDDLSEKVRKENKKMKRKLKKMRNLAAIHEYVNYSRLENSCTKRKLFNDDEDCDALVQLKKCHYDVSHSSLTKKERKYLRKQMHMEKRVNEVADTFDQICKI